MYVPVKAVIPNKVYVVCDRQALIDGATVGVRLASVYQKNKPKGVAFEVANEFDGPFTLSDIVGTNNGFGGSIVTESIFPFKNKSVQAECWLPDWALRNLVMSGAVNKGGVINPGIKMCAVTYGAHYTLVIKDGDVYNKIPKSP